MQRVLVVGGAGYIGSHTCKALRQEGFEPVAFDNLASGFRKNVRWGPFAQGDILDPGALGTAIRDYEPCAIIHFAARAYVAESVTDPALYYSTNVTGTLNVVEAARRGGDVPVIFSSSCATYGVPETVPITEETPQRPINPYGQSKLIGEQILRDYAAAYALRAIGLRYFNACGADPEGETGENPGEMTRLIPNAIRALLTGEPFTVFGDDYATGDGTAVRDYIHVSDLAAAHVAALQALLGGSQTDFFNVGTGTGISVAEIVETLGRVSGQLVPIRTGPRRAGDPPVLIAACDKASQELAFHPRYSDVETILSTALSWSMAQYGNLTRKTA